MEFLANFMRFPVVQKFWKSVKIWQSYREFKGGNFFETPLPIYSHCCIVLKVSPNPVRKMCVLTYYYVYAWSKQPYLINVDVIIISSMFESIVRTYFDVIIQVFYWNSITKIPMFAWSLQFRCKSVCLLPTGVNVAQISAKATTASLRQPRQSLTYKLNCLELSDSLLQAVCRPACIYIVRSLINIHKVCAVWL